MSQYLDPWTEPRQPDQYNNGDLVRVPKGTEVRSMHPARKTYITARAQVVRVSHMLSGRYVSVSEALGEYRPALEKQGFDFAQIEAWRDANAPEYYRMMVSVEEPSVRWPGTGGYWCEVPASKVEPVVAAKAA